MCKPWQSSFKKQDQYVNVFRSLPWRKLLKHSNQRSWLKLAHSYVFSFYNLIWIFGIINPFSWKANAISREKSCPISMPFLLIHIDVRTAKVFPPSESWLVNPNFPFASRMQGIVTYPVWKNRTLKPLYRFICYYLTVFLSIYSGSPESAETSHFDGGSCHCHIWNLLDAWRICAQLRLLHIPQCQWTRIRCYSYAGTVQFRCQPICLRSGEQNLPREAKGNDMV